MQFPLNKLLVFAASALFAVGSAHALDPDRMISQYGHTAWRVRDGDLPGSAYQITQTTDGYLWIGTQAGLVRFDGARFVPLTILTEANLPSLRISSLLAARDGGLWIGTTKGLAHWVHEELTVLPDRAGGVGAMLEDQSGSIWFASLRPRAELSLCQVGGADVRCYGQAEGIDIAGCCIGTLAQDRQGNFWLSTSDSVMRWKPGSTSAGFRVEAKARSGDPGPLILAPDPKGPLWVGVDASGPGLGLQQLSQGVVHAPIVPQLDPGSIAVQALLVDRGGTLWIGTLDQGIYRIQGDRIDNFRAGDGLSGDSVYWFFEDREGNLWVSTSGGIDRFRDVRVATYSTREGLSVTEADSLLATRDGRIWIGGADHLDILDHGHVASMNAGHGLPGHQVTAMMQDSVGQVWIGIDNTLNIYSNGRFVPVNGPDDRPIGLVATLGEDARGNIWADLLGTKGLVRIRENKAREQLDPGLGGTYLAASPAAGVWLLLRNGDLAHYQQGTFEKLSYQLNAGSNRNIIATSNGVVLGATDAGVVGWKDGRQRTLTSASGLPCNSINALTIDKQGSLWLAADCGLIQVPSEQLRDWWERGTRVRPQLLDIYDGVQPGRAPFGRIAIAPDGRLWLANGTVVQELDPANLAPIRLPLPVRIEQVIADGARYRAQERVRLPPNPRDIEIDYTALSLAIPQRVRFRYQLEGYDRGWQDPGARRQAYYTNLAPGSYTFRVIAAESSGVWNATRAQLDMLIVPAWYQTRWFRTLCVLFGAAALTVLYRLRVRQIATAIKARFDERLAERTRLARELHDTLLQTIQGSKMVADDALEASTDPAAMRRSMQRLSTWLARATQEGRVALNALRISTTEGNNLADGLKRASDDCLMDGSVDPVFSVTGEAREMHPIVRDEVYRIGYEAIRNACMHSKGSRLEVALTYARDLTLVVSDDGQGMDSATAAHGKKGHFGIQGMRERAERIGASVSIRSGERSGTEVRLVVPGRVIFRTRQSQASSFAKRLHGLFGQ